MTTSSSSRVTLVLYRALLRAAQGVEQAASHVPTSWQAYRRLAEARMAWHARVFNHPFTVAERVFMANHGAAPAHMQVKPLVRAAFARSSDPAHRPAHAGMSSTAAAGLPHQPGLAQDTGFAVLRDLQRHQRRMEIARHWHALLQPEEDAEAAIATAAAVAAPHRVVEGLALLSAMCDDDNDDDKGGARPTPLDACATASAIEELAASVTSDVALLQQSDEERYGNTLATTLDTLNRTMLGSLGYRASGADRRGATPAPATALLSSVLETRLAIPIVLCSIYAAVAQHCGLNVRLLSLPDMPTGLRRDDGSWGWAVREHHNVEQLQDQQHANDTPSVVPVVASNFPQNVLVVVDASGSVAPEVGDLAVVDACNGGRWTWVHGSEFAEAVQRDFGGLLSSGVTVTYGSSGGVSAGAGAGAGASVEDHLPGLPLLSSGQVWALVAQYLVVCYGHPKHANQVHLQHQYANLLDDMGVTAPGAAPRTSSSWLLTLQGGVPDFFPTTS